MDIVDIDKVLDDFELNEDNDRNNDRSDQLRQPIQVDRFSATSGPPQRNHQHQSTSPVPSKQFVNVSNVFHSLNEYVDSKVPQYVDYGEQQQPDDVGGVTSEELTTNTSSSSISQNAESKLKLVYEKSLLSGHGSLMTTSSSSSSSSSTESSTTDLSPRSITSSVSLIRNSPSLTNEDEVCKDDGNEMNDTTDISIVPKTKSETNDEPIELSSVSSMCLNEPVEQVTLSHSSYSQDVISNESESSSLSPLNPPEEQPIDDPVNEHIKAVVEIEPNQTVPSSLQPTKPIGFESTMDDVSDTELESYLQELELEPVEPVLNDASTNNENVATEDDADDGQTENVTETEANRAENDDSVEDRNQPNADSFSQASTVEFADTRLHSDFEQSPIAVDNVRVEKVEDVEEAQEDLSEAEVAVEGVSPYEKPLQRPNSLDLAVKVVVENECHSDVADQTPTEQAPPPPEPATAPVESSFSADISNMTSTSSSEDFGASSISASSTQPTTSQLGKVQPYWIPDNVTSTCMQCQIKFSLIKRRHHCRACGQVLCSACCSLRAKLEYMGDVEARVCTACERKLNRDDAYDSLTPDDHYQATDRPSIPPNPNNPMEYCSVIPPHQQVAQSSSQASPISVMVPVGVLKREGARGPRQNKNVMFSDGIRPGCDLTDLDDWDKCNATESGGSKKSSKRVSTPIGERPKNKTKLKLPPIDLSTESFIPIGSNALPPIYKALRGDFHYVEASNDSQLIETLHNETIKFAVQRNLYVFVRIVKLTCCMNKTVINFTTKGMHHVNQDEIVILLEMDDSNCLPKDIFLHLNEIYREAKNGTTISELGFSMPSHGNFLGSKEHGGFLYIRTTFQCLEKVNVPENPFLVAILIHRWEVPWAKIFPLRLMLRLGALHRYYPSPHVSVRGRNSVYAEIAQTIINFLADFRTYSYTLPTIHGMYIHMEERTTSMLIPRNRYDEVMKAMNNSSEYILALAANFSEKADGHLVCFQNTESGCTETRTYSTQAVNIQGRTRKVTGASFLVLNGALKSSSGLSGKCSIVEDGLMVQILPSKMVSVQKALREMKDFEILCGPVDGDTTQTEIVSVKWVDNDTEFNKGVLSPIDGRPMKGIRSVKVHRGYELASTNHIIRWTEVFIIQTDEDSQYGKDPTDVTKLSEQIAKSVSKALLSYLDLLVTSGFVKIGLRATLHPENVCYEAGGLHTKLGTLYMKALDNELIPVLHSQATNLSLDSPIVLELIFHILDD